MTYSIKKGLFKGITAVLTFVVAGLLFTGFADVQIWDLIVTYVKPVLGTLTVGGALTMALNYFKVRAKIANNA